MTRRRDWRAAVVLTAALATVFVFSAYDRGQFYRNAPHDITTDDQLAVATNLSPEHGFAQFYRREVGEDGQPTYKPYHRFPLLGYVLIKLAILPFPDDLSARLHAARMLMLAFFCGAAVLAYLTLRRLTGRRAVALAAVLLAFSSYPLLYYSDMVATEGVVDLFAVMLAFHGIAVYSQRRLVERGQLGGSGLLRGRRAGSGLLRGRRAGKENSGVGQMCIKSCAAVFFGWHVYGLLLPLLLAAVPLALWTRDWRALRHQVLLGAATVLVGLAMLAFNLAREHHGYGGAKPFLDLPSLLSAGRRMGFLPRDDFGWASSLQVELGRIGLAALPWVFAKPLPELLLGSWHWVGVACLGLAFLGICLPGTRHRLAWSALALCGLGWALPMRHNAMHHEFEWLFHVGAPLAASALALTRVRSFGAARGGRTDGLVTAAMVIGSFAVFVASSWLMGRVGDDAETRRWDRVLLADAQAIRHTLRGTDTTVRRTRHAFEQIPSRQAFLTGIVQSPASGPHDYVIAGDLPRIAPRRPPLANSPASRSLTPDNRVLFLYERDAYRAALAALQGVYEHHAGATNRPAIRGVGFRVHQLGSAALLYVGEGKRCPADRPEHRFFLRAYPADATDLPGPDPHPMGPLTRLSRTPFANLDFEGGRLWTGNGRCYTLRFLPRYPLIGVHTGELDARTGHPVWEGYLSLRDVAGEYRRLAAGEPTVRSAWDVYLLQGGTQLAYLKAPCALAEAKTSKFFLHLVPADPDDLPPSRRLAGFSNLDFHFLDRGGAVDDAKCLVRIPLPDYRIATVRTGQFDDAGPVWTAEFPVWSLSHPPPPQQPLSRPPPPQQPRVPAK